MTTGSIAAGLTPSQRLRLRALELASAVACRLPEAPLVAVAGLAGELWLLADRRRAEQGRRNLRRVCEWLAATGRGPARFRRAAHDRWALEWTLHSASRHHARYYLEVLRTPALTPEKVRARISLEDDDGEAGALAQSGGVIVVSLHFASLEVPGLYLAHGFGRPAVVPMETLGDPGVQAWLERTRSGVGLRLVPLSSARSAILPALARGEVAGIVADRDVAGGGVEVPLFGHPAPLPIGGALLALESGAPVYVMGARRVGGGRYLGRLMRLRVPPESGTRRERVTALLQEQARAFEDLIATAPDQWWSVFLPLWRDLVPETGRAG